MHLGNVYFFEGVLYAGLFVSLDRAHHLQGIPVPGVGVADGRHLHGLGDVPGLPVQVKAAHVRAHGLRAELPEHGGDLAPVVRPVVHNVLQAVNQRQGVGVSRRVPVLERLAQAILGEAIQK